MPPSADMRVDLPLDPQRTTSHLLDQHVIPFFFGPEPELFGIAQWTLDTTFLTDFSSVDEHECFLFSSTVILHSPQAQESFTPFQRCFISVSSLVSFQFSDEFRLRQNIFFLFFLPLSPRDRDT